MRHNQPPPPSTWPRGYARPGLLGLGFPGRSGSASVMGLNDRQGADMRTLLAIVLFVGGMLALDAAADAAPKSKRSTKPSPSNKAKVYRPKVDAGVVCAERARHEDPTGQYGNYPCWAREAFARGANINMQ